METALKAIAEPTRRRILELVADGELTAGDISRHFDVTRPAISQHLTVLKRAGLLEERRHGARRLYRAHRAGFAAVALFVEGLRDDGPGQVMRTGGSHSTVATERLCLRREMAVEAPPPVVWSLLTDAEQATTWMGTRAVFDLHPGGVYQVEVVPGEVARGEFVAIDPTDRLAFTWGWEGDPVRPVPPGQTIVVFDLTPIEAATLVRVTHRDLPDVVNAGSHSAGWGHYLERLAMAAEGRDPGPDPWVTDPDLRTRDLGASITRSVR